MQSIIFLYDKKEILYLLNISQGSISLMINQLQGIGKQLDSRSPGKEIYELIFEDVKPEYWKKYIEHQGEIIA